MIVLPLAGMDLTARSMPQTGKWSNRHGARCKQSVPLPFAYDRHSLEIRVYFAEMTRSLMPQVAAGVIFLFLPE
ncbi:MAG: hypothetical protein GW909_07060 [Sphingomonadales bacterium]|nr:hypothetical protein [Sphingomonadales bacterium]